MICCAKSVGRIANPSANRRPDYQSVLQQLTNLFSHGACDRKRKCPVPKRSRPLPSLETTDAEWPTPLRK
jgi:hypothetical protein